MRVDVVMLERILIGITDAPDLEARNVLRLDRPRLRVATRFLESPVHNVAEALQAQLRRAPLASLLELVTTLGAHPRAVRTELRRLDPAREASDAGHQDYRHSWFGRHVPSGVASPRVVAALRELCTVFEGDYDVVAFVTGAPSVRAIKEVVSPMEAPPPVTLNETVGISAAHAASTLKHELNDLLVEAAGLSGELIALEVGQGVGHGSLRYRRHGLVVAVENGLDVRLVAAGQVPHLDIPMAAGSAESGDPLALTPTDLKQRLAVGEVPPVLMFAQPTGAAAALRRLQDTDWRFNWIDIDPTGFAEANDIDVGTCYSVARDEALVCVTNGGWQAERYGTPRTMTEMLTSGCRVTTHSQRERQRSALVEHVLLTEAAYRVLWAADAGLALHPVLLYDGRHHPGGVVRAYYLLSRAGNASFCRQYVEFDADVHLNMVARHLIAPIERMGGEAPHPTKVPLVRFQDFSEGGGRLTQAQSEWLREVLGRRVRDAQSTGRSAYALRNR